MNADAQPSDEDLVRACQNGDFAAFEEIYRRYQRPILAYIYQITRNYDEAGSIAQDVFLKVFEHVARFDPTRRFSTWFYTIARNAAIDYLNARNRRSFVSFTDLDRQDGDNMITNATAGESTPVEDRLAKGEAVKHLAVALGAMPQIYREIIELIIFQERSYEEASEILGGVSHGTLRSRMFHALRRLRSELEHEGGFSEGDLI
jgi:RNA polymerase sigma-70 factor, ECF subfamily